MPISTQKVRDISIVIVDYERATIIVAEEFRSNVQSEIASGTKKFIFDLSKCNFIDSTFLSALIVSFKRIAETNGELRIFGLKPAVQAMFQLTRLTKIFSIFNDEQEALNSLR